MAKDKNSAVYVDVEFIPRVESFLEKVKSELSSEELEKYIGLDDAIASQVKKVRESLSGLKEEMRSVLGSNVSKNNVKTLEDASKKLEEIASQFQSIGSKIDENKLGSGITNSAKEAEQLSSEVRKTADSLSDIQKFYNDNKKLSVVDAREIDAIKELRSLLSDESYKNVDLIGDVSKDKQKIEGLISQLNVLYNKTDIGWIDDRAIIDPEEVNQISEFYKKATELSILNDKFTTKYGQKGISLFNEEQIGYITEFLEYQDKMEISATQYKDMLEKRYQNSLTFIKDIATKQTKIEIPVVADKSNSTLYQDTLNIIEKVKEELEARGATVPIKISVMTTYTNDKLKAEVKKLEEQVANSGASKGLKDSVKKLVDKIDEKVTLDLKFDENKASSTASKFISDLKKKFNQDLKITPVITIDEETKSVKTEEIQKQLDSISAKLKLDLGKSTITLGNDVGDKISKALNEATAKAKATSSKTKGDSKATEEQNTQAEAIKKLTTELYRLTTTVDKDFLSNFKYLKIPEDTISNLQNFVKLMAELQGASASNPSGDYFVNLANAITLINTIAKTIDPNIVSKKDVLVEFVRGLDFSLPRDFIGKCNKLGEGVAKLKEVLPLLNFKELASATSKGSVSIVPDLNTLISELEVVKDIAKNLDDKTLEKLAKVKTIPELMTFKIPDGFVENITTLNLGLDKLTSTVGKISKVVNAKGFEDVNGFASKFNQLNTAVKQLTTISKSLSSLSLELPANFSSQVSELKKTLEELKGALAVIDNGFVNGLNVVNALTKFDGSKISASNFESLRSSLTSLKDALKVLDAPFLKKLTSLQEASKSLNVSLPKGFDVNISNLSKAITSLKKALSKFDDSFMSSLNKLNDKKLSSGLKNLKDLNKNLKFEIPEDFSDRCENLVSAIETLKECFNRIDTDFMTNLTQFSSTMAEFKKSFSIKSLTQIPKVLKQITDPESVDLDLSYFTKLRNAYKKALKGDDIDLVNFKEIFKMSDGAGEKAAEEIKVYQDALLSSISTQREFDKVLTNPRVMDEYKEEVTGMKESVSLLGKEIEKTFSTGDYSNLPVILNLITKINSQIKTVTVDSYAPENTVATVSQINTVLNKLNSMSKYTAMSRQYREELDKIRTALTSGKTFSTAQVDKFNSRVIEIEKNVIKYGQNTKSVLDRLSNSIASQTVRYVAYFFSFYRVLQYFRQGWEYALQFDSALTKISYTMDLTDQQLSDMGKDILELSSALKTSISDMSTIYQIYSNMNTSAKEMSVLAESTAILSNLTGVDASTAADQIQGVVQQFKDLESVDASHIIDVFDYISSNIAVDYSKGIQGIAEAVQSVGNVADQAGLSFEQLSAIIAKTMEQTRAEGSQIANGLKTIMVRLSKASKMSDEVDNETLSNASKVLHEIGVEVYKNNGEFRDFDTIMSELAAKWDDLTDAQQANISFQAAA